VAGVSGTSPRPISEGRRGEGGTGQEPVLHGARSHRNVGQRVHHLKTRPAFGAQRDAFKINWLVDKEANKKRKKKKTAFKISKNRMCL